MNRFLMIAAFAAVTLSAGAQNSRSLSVAEMFSLLDENNSTIKVHRSATEAAQLGIEAAKSQRLPDVKSSLSVSYNGDIVMMDRDFSNAHTYDSPHFGNSFSLSAQQVVYSGGALTAGIRMAELEKQQTELSTQQTVQQQRFLALGQYLDLYKLRNRVKVYESNITLTETLIKNISAKYSEGMALKNDVTRYELQLEDLKLGLRKVQDQCAILNHQLCTTLGIEEISLIPDENVADNVQGADGDTHSAEASWQNEAAISSPDIQLSQLGTQMAEQGVKLAKSEMLPKIAIVAADEFNGPITYEIPALDNNINVWYVGVGITYPISSLFKSNKKVKQAQVKLRESQESQAVAREGINNAVQQSYTLYQQSYVDLATQQKSVQLAQQNYTTINERYLNQLALVTDMVDASNVKLNAELLEVDARINIVYAYYRMKYVSGTL